MSRRIEDFWQEQQGWWTSAFPFSRNCFQAIWTDITVEQYTSAEAIAKHLAGGDGMSPSEFLKLVLERYQGRARREDILEFRQGYSRLIALIQLAFVEVAHGPVMAAEMIRQYPEFGNDEFIHQNLQRASSLIREDIHGRKCIMLIANEEIEREKKTRSKRKYYLDGLMTACDSFVAYSIVCEGYFKGELN